MRILVTGCAGFIGSHVCEYLLKEKHKILGIDNMTENYDLNKKLYNLAILKKYNNFIFIKDNVCNTSVISKWKPDKICHLAAMTNIRTSISKPLEYIDNNIKGFVHIINEAHKNDIKYVVYASSSSVYGTNSKIPFSECDASKSQISIYGCSKMATELFARTYYELYNISMIGLRFFTVYGPRGRPDMAPYKFMDAIMKNKKFDKYGDGTSLRYYTYIDDIVNGIVASLYDNDIQCEIYNLTSGKTITLNKFIELCEIIVGNKAKYKQLNVQQGDMLYTHGDISKAQQKLNYFPKTNLEDGLFKFYKWLLVVNTKQINLLTSPTY